MDIKTTQLAVEYVTNHTEEILAPNNALLGAHEAFIAGYNKAGEWHYTKDKLPPEPESDGKQIFPKVYICAYALNNEYNDYEVGEFMYFGHGDWNGENKDYPTYAWLETPVVVPVPPKE